MWQQGYVPTNIYTCTLHYLLWTKSYRHWMMIEKMINEYEPMEIKKFDVVKRGGKKTPRNTSTSALFNSSRLVIKKRPVDYQTLLNDDTSRAMIGLRMEIDYKPLEKQTKTELMIMIDDAIRRCIGQVYGFHNDHEPYRYDLFYEYAGINLLISAAWHDKQFGYIFKPEVLKDIFEFDDRSGEELSKIAHECDEIYRLLWNLARVIRKLFSPYLTNDEITQCFDFSETEVDVSEVDWGYCLYTPKLWDADRMYGVRFPGTLHPYSFLVKDEELIEFLKNDPKLSDVKLELLSDFPWMDEYAEEGKKLVANIK